MNRKPLRLLSKQQGITLWQVLLLVVVAVTLAVCVKTDRLPFFPLSRMTDAIRMPDFLRANNNNTYDPPPDYLSENTSWTRYAPEVKQASSRKASIRRYEEPAAPYEEEFPVNIERERGYYTVQVFSGYNSQQAYELRRALKKDGYNSYISEETDGKGILFRVRIGQYRNRSDVFAVREQVKRRYPARLRDSFVMLVEDPR